MSAQELEGIDFSGVVLAFSSAALSYLEEGGELNLPLAQHNVQILELLREKTAGNLTADESLLLDQVISDVCRRLGKFEKSSV